MELEVYTLTLGTIDTDSSYTLWRHNPGEIYTTLVPAFLIRGGEKPILVETGFSDPQSMLKYGSRNPVSKPEWDIVAQLAKFKVQPEDVGMIIYTHLHSDHCGQTIRFPNAKIVVQREELRTVATTVVAEGSPVARESARARMQLITPLLTECWNNMVLLDGEEEIVKGIKCVHVGGHTHGLQAVYVETAKGTAILGGDNAYRFENFENGAWPPGQIFGSWDDTILALKKYIKEGRYIVPSHDLKVLEKYPQGKIPP